MEPTLKYSGIAILNTYAREGQEDLETTNDVEWQANSVLVTGEKYGEYKFVPIVELK